MKPIPVPSRNRKNIPDDNNQIVETPNPTTLIKDEPVQREMNKEAPVKPELTKEEPLEKELNKEIPEKSELNKNLPSDVAEENCVKINDKTIELKPTKLKYFRNKMASAYGIIKAVPLNDFLSYGKGVVDPDRDADQVLYDFLVAAFDDSAFVRDHYDDMTAEDVEQVIRIFGRLNHIDEKEEQARKNKEAQAKR